MKKLRSTSVAPGIFAIAPACFLFGGTGACVSSVVNFQFTTDKVYCYSGWDQPECADYNTQQANNATWSLQYGQDCDDLGYIEGSNPWP
jgi:hypothetical protein